MNKKGMPRLLLEQETGQTKNNLSESDCNIIKEKKQMVFDLLPKGEEHAIRTSELVHLAGVRSARELQNRIATERDEGALILSSCRNGGGYYRPSDGEQGQQEIAAFIRTLRARALNTLSAIKTARKALEGIEGQLNLENAEGL